MPSAKRTKVSGPGTTIDVELLLSGARAELAKSGSFALTKVKPKAAQELLKPRLIAEGFEVDGTTVRYPIDVQLRQALAHGATVAMSSLASHVRGAKAPAVKKAALSMAAKGEARLVLRGAVLTLAGPHADVFSREELAHLRGALEPLSKSLAKLAKSGATLLRSDVRSTLDAAFSAPSRPRRQSATAPDMGANAHPADLAPVLAAVDAAHDPSMGLSFVPHVVTRLTRVMDPRAAALALLSGATRGMLELRPEGGLHRLSEAELALCPEGPQGTRLSWVRRTEEGAAR